MSSVCAIQTLDEVDTKQTSQMWQSVQVQFELKSISKWFFSPYCDVPFGNFFGKKIGSLWCNHTWSPNL